MKYAFSVQVHEFVRVGSIGDKIVIPSEKGIGNNFTLMIDNWRNGSMNCAKQSKFSSISFIHFVSNCY